MSDPITITTPSIVSATTTATQDEPAVTLRAMHNPHTDRYATMSILVEHPMVAVTPTLMRRLRLRDVKSQLLRQELAAANPELMAIAPLKTFLKGTAGRAVSTKDREAPSTERLEQTLAILRLARLTGDFAAVSVMRCFGIERTDAEAWIKLAQRHLIAT
jgi:hypothetical protein